MDNKQTIITLAIGLGALLGVGFLFKYFSSSKPKEEMKEKTEEKKEEKEQKKDDFVPLPNAYEKKELAPKTENKIVFSNFAVSDNPFSFVLQHLKIDDLTQEISPRVAYFVKSDQTVEECINFLSEKQILSTAVVDDKMKVVGIVDLFDVISHLISVMPEKKDMNDTEELERSYRAVNAKKITEIMNKSGRNPYEPMYQYSPALSVVGMFSAGLHRIPVLDDKDDLVVTISQSLIIRYLAEKMKVDSDLKALGKKTIKELYLGQVKVNSLKASDSIIKAFKIMNKYGYSAIPVVGKDKIIGNISNSDVKGFCAETIPSFNQKISYYLEKQSEKSLKPVTCKLDDSLVSVIDKLASGPHRVWVVDEKERPHSVVSMTDIFKLIRDYEQPQ